MTKQLEVAEGEAEWERHRTGPEVQNRLGVLMFRLRDQVAEEELQQEEVQEQELPSGPLLQSSMILLVSSTLQWQGCGQGDRRKELVQVDKEEELVQVAKEEELVQVDKEDELGQVDKEDELVK